MRLHRLHEGCLSRHLLCTVSVDFFGTTHEHTHLGIDRDGILVVIVYMHWCVFNAADSGHLHVGFGEPRRSCTPCGGTHAAAGGYLVVAIVVGGAAYGAAIGTQVGALRRQVRTSATQGRAAVNAARCGRCSGNILFGDIIEGWWRRR